MRYDPARVLALAVLRQALYDYSCLNPAHRREAEHFLRGVGREIWLALGLKESLLDEYLAEPAKVRRVMLAGADRSGQSNRPRVGYTGPIVTEGGNV